jgi:hypothetical protein
MATDGAVIALCIILLVGLVIGIFLDIAATRKRKREDEVDGGVAEIKEQDAIRVAAGCNRRSDRASNEAPPQYSEVIGRGLEERETIQIRGTREVRRLVEGGEEFDRVGEEEREELPKYSATLQSEIRERRLDETREPQAPLPVYQRDWNPWSEIEDYDLGLRGERI